MSSAPVSPFQPMTVDAAPRPWRSISGDSQICDKGGMFVADVAQGISGTCWPTSRANARLIVEAVNSHASLRSQVSELRDALREIIASNQVQVFRTIQIDSAGNTMEIIKVDGPCAAIARKALAVNSQHSDGEAK